MMNFPFVHVSARIAWLGPVKSSLYLNEGICTPYFATDSTEASQKDEWGKYLLLYSTVAAQRTPQNCLNNVVLIAPASSVGTARKLSTPVLVHV